MRLDQILPEVHGPCFLPPFLCGVVQVLSWWCCFRCPFTFRQSRRIQPSCIILTLFWHFPCRSYIHLKGDLLPPSLNFRALPLVMRALVGVHNGWRPPVGFGFGIPILPWPSGVPFGHGSFQYRTISHSWHRFPSRRWNGRIYRHTMHCPWMKCWPGSHRFQKTSFIRNFSVAIIVKRQEHRSGSQSTSDHVPVHVPILVRCSVHDATIARFVTSWYLAIFVPLPSNFWFKREGAENHNSLHCTTHGVSVFQVHQRV